MNYLNIKSLFLVAAIFVGFSPALVLADDEVTKPVIEHVSYNKAKEAKKAADKKVKEAEAVEADNKEAKKAADKKVKEAEAVEADNKEADKKTLYTKAKVLGASIAALPVIAQVIGFYKNRPMIAWSATGIVAVIGGYVVYQQLQEDEEAF